MKQDIQKKKVLILGTDDSSLTLIAKAVLNRYLRSVEAFSAGINASKKVDANTQRVLEENGLWSKETSPKQLDELGDMAFDLVITLSELAMKKCPDFSATTDIIAIEYDEPNPKSYASYKEALKLIQMEITPIVRMHLEG